MWETKPVLSGRILNESLLNNVWTQNESTQAFLEVRLQAVSIKKNRF